MPESLALPVLPIEQFRFENGLRIVVNEDHSVPVVSVAVYYDVGSRNERPGRTGFAHLFEHMMFQGSDNVPKAGHFQWISNAGGTMNGTTSTERTNYFETLPANQLPLALWLESDRMRSLKVTQENLDNQRHAVQEEKRLRIDNQPYIPAFLRLSELGFKNFANAHSTIGSMEDLDEATVEDVREFFRIYYAPNNAVLSISGDFQPNEALALIEKYFSTIPRQPEPPSVDVSEPPEVALNSELYKDQFAPLPGFIVGWKIPQRRTKEFYSLALAGDILFEGDSSRLYQKLVKGEESVVSIQGGLDERRGPSAIYIFGLPKPDRKVEQIRDKIMSEIKDLATNGPTDEEMVKVRNKLWNNAVRSRQMSLFRAQKIAEFMLYDGDPSLVNTELNQYLEISSEDIRRIVADYLDTENRVTVDIVPAPSDEIQPPAAPEVAGEPAQPAGPPPQIPPKPDPSKPEMPSPMETEAVE